jgi:hypothetical protein
MSDTDTTGAEGMWGELRSVVDANAPDFADPQAVHAAFDEFKQRMDAIAAGDDPYDSDEPDERPRLITAGGLGTTRAESSGRTSIDIG